MSERETLQLIDERDAAQEAMSQAYYVVIGQSPEWSNKFGYPEALEDIDDAVATLKQSLRWQPIETAPKDGSHILVGTFPARPGTITITTAHWWEHENEWSLSINYDGDHSNHGVRAPTHWMPLPVPPAS